MTTTTKAIARLAKLPVSAVNEIARDLKIAGYEKHRRSWTVADTHVPVLLSHLSTTQGES